MPGRGSSLPALLTRAVVAQAVAIAVLLAVGLSQAHRVNADLAADRGAGTSVPLSTVARSAAPPVTLNIPALKINTRLVGLRKARNGTLAVPTDYQRAGWWSQGPAPGDPGAAVIVGHVDSKTGPAIFNRLDTLRKGDRIAFRRADGSIARFVVQQVKSYPKREFPTRLVYQGTPGQASLRLITCGGSFDAARGHYRNNTIVFATLIPPAPAKATTRKPTTKKAGPAQPAPPDAPAAKASTETSPRKTPAASRVTPAKTIPARPVARAQARLTVGSSARAAVTSTST